MIEEDYVSFETAKLLKERGFDEDLDEWYDSSGEAFHCPHYDIRTDHRYKESTVYQRPTLHMALKWLRERDIFVNIFHYNMASSPFIWFIFAYNAQEPQHTNTYEQAEEAAIRYALKNWVDIRYALSEYHKRDPKMPYTQ